jgi:MFS family permease
MARAQVPTIVTPAGGLAHPRLLAPVLVIVVAGNAAGAMIVEIVAGRMLAPYFGMSIHTWTTVIGVVLTGLAIGHWAGGRIADAYPGKRTAALGLACLAGAVTTILILPLVALVAGTLSLSGVPLPTAILVTGFAAFLVPSLTAGLVQPIATTVALESLGRRAGSVVGRMLAAGVVGAIVGTFLAGFVLIAQLGSAGSIWLVAAVNALLGAMLVATVRQRVAAWGLFALASAFAMTGTALPGFAAPCDHESRYYCISVFPGEMRNLPEARMLRIDALMHSVNHADPSYLAFSHLQWMDELARHRFGSAPFASFFIGGGGYTLPRAWLARTPGNEITVAELDPQVTAIARDDLWFNPGPATRILHTDARLALRRDLAGRPFDVIVGDAFRDIALPAHLITDEFHRLVRARLRDDGFYVLNLIDAVSSRRLVASVVKTLRPHFDAIEIWYDTAAYQRSDRVNFIVYASSRGTGLASPLRSQSAPDTEWARMAPESLETMPGAILLTDDFAPVEHLLGHRPAAR